MLPQSKRKEPEHRRRKWPPVNLKVVAKLILPEILRLRALAFAGLVVAFCGVTTQAHAAAYFILNINNNSEEVLIINQVRYKLNNSGWELVHGSDGRGQTYNPGDCGRPGASYCPRAFVGPSGRTVDDGELKAGFIVYNLAGDCGHGAFDASTVTWKVSLSLGGKQYEFQQSTNEFSEGNDAGKCGVNLTIGRLGQISLIEAKKKGPTASGNTNFNGNYRIVNTWRCPDNEFCNWNLSWTDVDPHPKATVENDGFAWEIKPIAGKPNHYNIRNKWRCPDQEWCNAGLTWDAPSLPTVNEILAGVTVAGHPLATVEHTVLVEWKITPDPTGKAGHYYIQNTYGCPSHEWCDANLSWDTERPHPRASIENDGFTWKIIAE